MRLKSIACLMSLALVTLLLAGSAAAQSARPNVVKKGRTSSSPAPARDATADLGGTRSAASPSPAGRDARPDFSGKAKALGVARRIDPLDDAEGPPQFPATAEDVIVCVAGCDGARGAVLNGKQ
jgi:hypothetical protein